MDESNIIQFSMPRTGSTLLYQVISDLFPDSIVSKAHDWFPEYNNKIVVGSYRDPRAVAVSYWRTNKNIDSPKVKMSDNDIGTYVRAVNGQAKAFEPYIKNTIGHKKIMFLKYELFYSDFEYLFSELEKFFDKEFDPKLLDEIANKRSIYKNKEIASTYKSFKQYDESSFIHGKHIYKDGDSSLWIDFLKPNDVKKLERGLAPSLKILGYL